jgi:hypothetical protein
VALTTTLSSQEFARISALAYEGLPCRVSLHVNSGSLTAESTVAEWDAVKLTDGTNGYADFVVGSLPAGGLDSGSDDRWEIGGSAGANTYIEAAFSAEGAGFSFDTVMISVGGGTYPHSILVESPSVTVAAGQTQTYRIQLLIDNI